MKQPAPIVVLLSLSQVVSWGSSYYAFPVQVKAMAPALGMSQEAAFAAFSGAMLAAALAAPMAGRMLDRHGARRIMSAGSILMAAAFLMFAGAGGPAAFWSATLLMGVAMSMTLYEAAFATVVQVSGSQAKRHITYITLAGGFASTLFWPGASYLNAHLGWRDTYLLLAALQLLVCLPAHLAMPRHSGVVPAASRQAGSVGGVRNPQLWLVAIAFSSASLVSSAVSLHLLGILAALGQGTADAIWLAALIGPFQVLGRVVEIFTAGRIGAERWALAITAAIPAAFAILLGGEGSTASVLLFIAIYGVSNGLMTIVRGTLPLELFGAAQYGQLSGLIAAPAMVCKALGPFALAAALGRSEHIGVALAALLAVSLMAPVGIAATIAYRRSIHQLLRQP